MTRLLNERVSIQFGSLSYDSLLFCGAMHTPLSYFKVTRILLTSPQVDATQKQLSPHNKTPVEGSLR